MRSSRTTTVILAVMVTLVVISLETALVIRTVRRADTQVGFSFADHGPLSIDEVAAGSPAERGGLKPGDLIAAINGSSIATVAEYDALAERFVGGRAVVFRVGQRGEQVELTIVPGRPVDWPPLILNACAVLAYLALALLVLLQRSHDRRATLLVAFSVAVAVELSWPPSFPFAPWVASISLPSFFILSGLQLALELHLVSLIPRPLPVLVRKPRLVLSFYAVGGLIATLGGTWPLIESRFGQALPFTSADLEFAFSNFGLPLWGVAVTAVLIHQVRLAREPLARQQASLVLLGELPWAAHLVVTTPITLAGGALPSWNDGIVPIVTLCLPVAAFIAVFRYHLFDFELVVRRSLMYGTLTGALVLVFYATVGVSSALFSRLLTGLPSTVAVAVATLALAMLFSPLRRHLQFTIDRRFFPERQAQRQRLSTLARELPALGTVPRMAAHLVEETRQMFSASSATLFVADPASRALVTVASTEDISERSFDESVVLSGDDPALIAISRAGRPVPITSLVARNPQLGQRLAAFNAELAVPLRCADRLVGLLLTGAKTGKGTFVAEEIELLGLLGSLAATVFENARLFESATHDGLTGLLRREAIVAHLGLEFQRASRYHRPLSVGMLDIDHFKQINDAHGHLAGDAVLTRVAQAAASALRATDAIGRWGGEEFLIVLPETTLDGARKVAAKILAQVAATRVRLGAREPVTVSVSIGLATLGGGEEPAPTSAVDLLAAADARLLEAKAAGRNRLSPEG